MMSPSLMKRPASSDGQKAAYTRWSLRLSSTLDAPWNARCMPVEKAFWSGDDGSTSAPRLDDMHRFPLVAVFEQRGRRGAEVVADDGELLRRADGARAVVGREEQQREGSELGEGVGEQRAEHSVRRALAEKTEQVLRSQHGLWVPRAHQLSHGRLQQDIHEVLRPERSLGAAGYLRRGPEHQSTMHSTEPHSTPQVLHRERDELFRLGGAEANQGLAYLLAHTLVSVARGAEQHLNGGHARGHWASLRERCAGQPEIVSRSVRVRG